MKRLTFLLLLLSTKVAASSSLPQQPVKLSDGSGNTIGSTGGSLNVNVTGSSGGGDGAILDGVSSSIKATVTGALALKVDGSAVTQPVSGTFFQATQPVSGSLGRTWTLLNSTDSVNSVQSGTWNITNVSGTVSLPTGASTSVKQPALGVAGTASADVITVQGIASMTALKVDGSAVTQPVSGTVAATQSGTWTVQPGNTANTTAWKVDGSAVTQPVSIASQPSPQGMVKANAPVRNDYSSVNVTTAAYVTLVASTSDTINLMQVADTSGQTLKIATGAAASEVDQFIVPPGGSGSIPITIAIGTRISIKALSATASTGEIDLSFLK